MIMLILLYLFLLSKIFSISIYRVYMGATINILVRAILLSMLFLIGLACVRVAAGNCCSILAKLRLMLISFLSCCSLVNIIRMLSPSSLLCQSGTHHGPRSDSSHDTPLSNQNQKHSTIV